MLASEELWALWMTCVIALGLKMIFVTQCTVMLRIVHGSFTCREGVPAFPPWHMLRPRQSSTHTSTDYEFMRATYGEPPDQIEPFATPALQRLAGIHRNDVENIVRTHPVSIWLPLSLKLMPR